MKEILSKVAAVLCGSAVLFGLLMYATSAEAWHAGEHLEGCNGSQDCGCYEKLLEMDRKTAETTTRNRKR